MISTFQRNRHFRKVLVNKTFTHVQEQKKRRCREIVQFNKREKRSWRSVTFSKVAG